MAYKFQLGAARLSGSLIQEGSVTAESSNLSGSTISLGNASGIAGSGIINNAGNLQLDFNDLSAGTWDTDVDRVPYLDVAENAANGPHIVIWNDLVGAAANRVGTTTQGSDLTTDAGSIKATRSTIINRSSGQDLFGGFNRIASLGSDGEHIFELSLPNDSWYIGQGLIVKAPADCSSARFITIRGNTGDGAVTFDGAATIRLESPNASVELIYVAAGTFSII